MKMELGDPPIKLSEEYRTLKAKINCDCSSTTDTDG